MRKIGGIVLVGLLGLTACSASAGAESAPSPGSSETAASRIDPLVSVPSESAIPTPTASLPPEFYDDSARGKYLAGVKKALNAWRDGIVPSDDDLIRGAEASCALYDQGKTTEEISAFAGPDGVAGDNAYAVAAYAGRYLCTKYNRFS
jgi:hypothetical protein